MKILITSGGTKVKIDDVRHIGNMSTGKFGTEIARECLLAGHDVTLLRAKNSKSLVNKEFNFNQFELSDVIQYKEEFDSYKDRLYETEYSTFEDYMPRLFDLIETYNYDVIIMCAAVSDYGVVNSVDGKIDSSSNIDIKLFPYPKTINQIKTLSPNSKLVGFKLLVDSTEEELINASRKSIQSNNCDLIVANDLRDIKKGNHKIMMVTKDSIDRFDDKKDNLAKIVSIFINEL